VQVLPGNSTRREHTSPTTEKVRMSENLRSTPLLSHCGFWSVVYVNAVCYWERLHVHGLVSLYTKRVELLC